MKLSYILPLACSALALATANAQGPDALRHHLAIDLTIKSEGDYQQDYKKDEASYKDSVELITEKISNKELLKFFVDENLIDSVKGWSIALFSYDGDIFGSYLVKKGEDFINITEYFSADLDDLEVDTFKGAYSDKNDTYDSKSTINSLAYVGLYLGDFSYESQGAFEGTYKYISDDGTYMTGAKLTGLSGIANDDGDDFGVVTGSATAGEGKVLPPM